MVLLFVESDGVIVDLPVDVGKSLVSIDDCFSQPVKVESAETGRQRVPVGLEEAA